MALALNERLRAGRARALRHEPRYREVVEQALRQAARESADRFERTATHHLTAAAPAVGSAAAMVAVYPSPEQAVALAQAGGAPAETLHVTLVFLGEVAPDAAEAALAAVRPVAAAMEGPLEGVTGGVAAFWNVLAALWQVAERVRPAGGYGDTFWNDAEKTVLWIPADWTSLEESDAAVAAFAAVNGVARVVVADAEASPQTWDDDPAWTPVWPTEQLLYPSILLPDVPGLAELRQAVCEALDGAGIGYAENHGWTPHLTISYTDDLAPPPARLLGLPLTFDALTVARGDVPRDLPFGSGRLVAAGDPPGWTPPYPDEVFDVDAFLSTLRTKTDPIRRAAIEDGMGGTLDEHGLSFDVTNPYVARTLERAGAKVTNIAETTRLNVMRTIRRSYEEGLSIPDTAKAIRAGMEAAAPARATLIARTEMNAVANGGALAATRIVADATGDSYAKRWMTAPGAEFPRHEDYDGLNGQTVPLDATFDVGGFQLEFPGDPDGPPEEVCNCFTGSVRVETPALRAAMRRWHEGEVVEVRLAAGDVLAATPNHPVLRSDGRWVPLGEVVEGDYLVSAALAREDVGAPHEQRPPSTISEVYDLAADAGVAERVVVGPRDLHGDASADGQVDVIPVDGSLFVDATAASEDEVSELGFAFAHAARASASGSDGASMMDGFGTHIAWSAASGIGYLREGTTLIVCHSRRAQPVRLGAGSDGQAEFVEAEDDRSSIDAELSGDGENAVAAFVALTEVVEVERKPFHGFVYNLDTGEGWYTAQTIVCRNCRCDLEMVESGAAASEGDAEAGAATVAGDDEGVLSAELPDIAGDSPEALAASLLDRAHPLEKAVTSTLRAVVEPQGGMLEGLAFKLKGRDSLTRKIRDRALVRGVSAREVASEITDVLRYTTIYTPGEYTAKMETAITDLERRGFRVVELRNFWRAQGADYVGVNMTLATPNGFRFELQFHTPDSFHAKEVLNHKFYEETRAIPPPPPERLAELERKMVANVDPVRRPPGAIGFQHLAGEPVALVSPSDAATRLPSTLEPRRQVIERELAALDQRMSLPDSAEFEVRVTGNPQIAGKNVEGGFVPDSADHGHIEIRRLSENPPEAFVHEFGHYVDWLLGNGQRYGSEVSPELDGFVAAALASPSARARADAFYEAGGTSLKPTDIVDLKGARFYASAVEYTSDRREMFARAFVQWMAQSDPELAVAVKLGQNDARKEALGWYWPDNEFGPIAEAVEAVLRAKGWLR